MAAYLCMGGIVVLLSLSCIGIELISPERDCRFYQDCTAIQVTVLKCCTDWEEIQECKVIGAC